MRLSDEEIKSINHTKETLDKDIKTLEDKLKGLHKLSGKLSTYLWDRKFECPEKFPDPICLNCKFALPEPGQIYSQGRNYYQWKYPGNIIKDDFRAGDAYCTQWRKKIRNSICGCAGDMFCECGYWEDFCYVPDDPVCPFCGKVAKVNKAKNILGYSSDDNKWFKPGDRF